LWSPQVFQQPQAFQPLLLFIPTTTTTTTTTVVTTPQTAAAPQFSRSNLTCFWFSPHFLSCFPVFPNTDTNQTGANSRLVMMSDAELQEYSFDLDRIIKIIREKKQLVFLVLFRPFWLGAVVSDTTTVFWRGIGGKSSGCIAYNLRGQRNMSYVAGVNGAQ